MSKKAAFYFILICIFGGGAFSQGLTIWPYVRFVNLLTLSASTFAMGCFFVLWIKAWRNSGKDETDIETTK